MDSATHLVPLTPERHGGFMWQRFSSYQFAKKRPHVVLAEAEIAQAAAWMPLLFIATAQGHQAIALCSLDDDVNLLVDAQGQWRAPYVPSALRSHPFGLHPEQPEQLCINESAAEVVDHYDAEPFFNDQGKLARFPQQVLTFLQQRLRSCETLANKVEQLATAGLITPWQPNEYTGKTALYRIDEQKWNQQTSEDIAYWWEQGVVPMVYAHLMSLSNLTLLLHHQRASHVPPSKQPSTATSLDGLRDAMRDEPEYHWPVR